MKKFYLIILFTIIIQGIKCQNWLWAQQKFQDQSLTACDMKGSPDGNIFTSVSWAEPGLSALKGHVVISAYNTNGQLLWQDSIHTYEHYGLPVKLFYSNSNLCVIGNFSNKVKIGDTLLTSSTSGFNRNSFVARYSTSSILTSVKQLKCTGDMEINDFYSDSLNNFYITGWFSKQCNFKEDSFMNVTGKRDLFVAKYNNSGNLTRFLNAWNIDTAYFDSRVQGENIIENKNGDLILGGSFNAGMVFTNVVDSFIGYEPYRDFIFTIDKNDNITHSKFETETGYSMHSTDFNIDEDQLVVLRNYYYNHGSGSLIVKFDTNMNPVDTIHFYTRSGNYPCFSGMQHYVFNKQNKLFFIGKRAENFTSDEYNDFNYLSIAKYDSGFNLQWIDSTVDNVDAYYTAVACDTLNNIYVQGIFTNTLFIAGNNLSVPSSTAGTFFARIKDETVVGIRTNLPEKEIFSIIPNPSSGIINIKRTGSSPATIKVYDSKGNIVYSTIATGITTGINLENQQVGLYLVEITEKYSVSSMKIIRQ